MKTPKKSLKIAKENIIDMVNNYTTSSVTNEQFALLMKIEDAIDYSIRYWDKSIFNTYKNRAEFVEDWIENQDWDAYGFNEKQIIELFS